MKLQAISSGVERSVGFNVVGGVVVDGDGEAISSGVERSVGFNVVGGVVVDGDGEAGGVIEGGVEACGVPPMVLFRYITSTTTPTTIKRANTQLPTKMALYKGRSCHFCAPLARGSKSSA